MIARKPISLVLLLALAPNLASACGELPALGGVLSIPQCDPTPASEDCVPGGKAVYEALQALEIPDVFTIGIQTSPWRMYDADGRIVTVEEMAASVRAQRSDTHRGVHLIGSWTALRPDGDSATLAQRLSDALEGFPVDGSDGFLWLGPKGEMRTTRQAISIWRTGPYGVGRGDEVMMALVPGVWSQFEDHLAQEGSADGVMQAGIGYDVFMLCQERALAAFERAAEMGSAIGAYNAGMMHAQGGDRGLAIAWLERAETLGEAKAAVALGALHRTRQAD